MVDLLTCAHCLLSSKEGDLTLYSTAPIMLQFFVIVNWHYKIKQAPFLAVRGRKIMCSTLAGLEPAISGVGNRRLIH